MCLITNQTKIINIKNKCVGTSFRPLFTFYNGDIYQDNARPNTVRLFIKFLQTETSRNGASGHSERLFHR
jgi:hypothetical protein